MESLLWSLLHACSVFFAFLHFLVFVLVISTIVFRSKGYYIHSTFETKVFQSHRMDENDIRPGDHIYTWTPFFIYSHHGICVGRNKVIHFTGAEDGIFASSASWFSGLWPSKPIPVAMCDFPGCGDRYGSGVIQSCINCFKEGRRSVYRYQYGLGTYEYMLKLRDGTGTLASSDPTSKVIERANKLLKIGFGTYYVVSNNCEDFALYCKTGYTSIGRAGCSRQIISRVNLVTIFINCWAVSRYVSWPVLAFVAAPLYRSSIRYLVDILIIRKGVKIEANDLPAWRSQRHRR